MKNEKPTVIVTGGAGYIGSHTIIELLLNTDYHVVSIDNFSNSSEKTYDRIRKISQKSFDHYNIDLCGENGLEKVFQEHSKVIGLIHFAAFMSVPDSVANPYKYYHNNINAQLNVMQACVKHKVRNFIFSSSCSVYGNIDQLPVNEQTPIKKAESPYAYTKQAGEIFLKDFCIAFPELRGVALRYFNPVGAHASGMNGDSFANKPTNLVPLITAVAAGIKPSMEVCGTDYNTRDGSCVRDYIHVTDIALAHIKALSYLLENKEQANYLVFNLGSGNGVSVLEAIASFEKVSGVKLNYRLGPRRAGDVEAIYSDTSFTEKVLGWKAKFSLDEMMESAWKWQKYCN